MSYELPDLILGTNDYGRKRYLFADNAKFPTDAWVPSLLDIHNASTIGEQRSAFETGIVGLVANSGIVPAGETHARIMIDYGDYARVRIKAGRATLSSLRSGDVLVGYQTSDEECLKPAFAVYDTTGLQHEVFKDPDQDLTELARSLSLTIFTKLADQFDSRYPGFELHSKIEDAGINLSILEEYFLVTGIE